MKTHFELFAAYNTWANKKIYDAARALSDSDYRRDEKAFFGSVHATLNHILVADRVWMHRFTGRGETYDKLDLILFEELDALHDARMAEDQRIVDWIETKNASDFDETFTYQPVTTPEPVTSQYAPCVAHFFNHQTHHRGQVHALLTRLSGKAPSIDLIYFHIDRKQRQS